MHLRGMLNNLNLYVKSTVDIRLTISSLVINGKLPMLLQRDFYKGSLDCSTKLESLSNRRGSIEQIRLLINNMVCNYQRYHFTISQVNIEKPIEHRFNQLLENTTAELEMHLCASSPNH